MTVTSRCAVLYRSCSSLGRSESRRPAKPKCHLIHPRHLFFACRLPPPQFSFASFLLPLQCPGRLPATLFFNLQTFSTQMFQCIFETFHQSLVLNVWQAKISMSGYWIEPRSEGISIKAQLIEGNFLRTQAKSLRKEITL